MGVFRKQKSVFSFGKSKKTLFSDMGDQKHAGTRQGKRRFSERTKRDVSQKSLVTNRRLTMKKMCHFLKNIPGEKREKTRKETLSALANTPFQAQ